MPAVDDGAHLPAGQQPYDAAISPAEGAPGTRFDIFGRGFREQEMITFWGYAPDGTMHYLGRQGTNQYGRVDWVWETGSAELPGEWTIAMRGAESGVERIDTLRIVVPGVYPEEGTLVDTYDSAVTPARGVPGTWFTLFIDHFDAGETVFYTISGPDGTVYEEGQRHATERGRVDWEWTSPADATEGTWTLVAHGRESQRARVVSLEIAADADNLPRRSNSRPYTAAVVPGEAPPGSTFFFFATGYTRKEMVDYVCLDASGAAAVRGSVRANPLGRADWTCETGSGAAPGTWGTVAIGRDSGVSNQLSFNVVSLPGAP